MYAFKEQYAWVNANTICIFKVYIYVKHYKTQRNKCYIKLEMFDVKFT